MALCWYNGSCSGCYAFLLTLANRLNTTAFGFAPDLCCQEGCRNPWFLHNRVTPPDSRFVSVPASSSSSQIPALSHNSKVQTHDTFDSCLFFCLGCRLQASFVLIPSISYSSYSFEAWP
jgi:hypothetical protein